MSTTRNFPVFHVNDRTISNTKHGILDIVSVNTVAPNRYQQAKSPLQIALKRAFKLGIALVGMAGR